MKTNKFFSRIAIALGMVLVFAASGWAIAESEPNDNCGEANPLLETNTTTTGARNGSTVSGNPDYFEIFVDENRTLKITITNETQSKDLEFDMKMASECGNMFGATMSTLDGGDSRTAYIFFTPGYYYIAVRGVHASQATSYDINVSIYIPGGGEPGGYVNTSVGVNDTGLNYDTDRYITTKLVNKPFGLRASYLDGNGNVATYNGAFGNNNTVNMSVIFSLAGDECTDSYVIGQTEIVHNTTHTDTGDIFNLQNAAKAKRIQTTSFDFGNLFRSASGLNCANSSLQSSLCLVPACFNDANNIASVFPPAFYPHINTCINGDGGGTAPCDSNAYNGNCGGKKDNVTISPSKYNIDLGCAACLADAFQNEPCSPDNFAIRPEKFEITSTHYDWANILRSAEDYNTTIQAYKYNTTVLAPDYNQTRENLILNKTLFYQDGSTAVAGLALFGNLEWNESDFNMSNGISLDTVTGANEVAGITFDDVGKVRMELRDMNWAAVDINDVNGLGDPTLSDCSLNGGYICADQNVTFIPHRFDFADLNITDNNGNPGTFTYIANEVDLMAARIHTKMRALNKDGNVTRNFAQFPRWENSVTVTPVVQIPATKYRFPSTNIAAVVTDANETIINNLAIGFATDGDDNGTKTVAWDETNTSQYLRFNFPREHNATILPLPFDVNGSELNITIASSYVDPDTAHTANIRGDRNETAEMMAHFVYGRLIPRDVRVFGTNVNAIATAWYEVNQSPDINGTALPPSKNDSQWYINTLHVDLSDGDGQVTQLQTGGAASVAQTPPVGGVSVQGVETYNFGHLGIGGYKAHINTDPWLWYGVNALDYVDPATGNTETDCFTHPCFNITVVPVSGATGSAKEESEETKESKKSDQGTGWKSTTDYAPAVR